MVGNLHVRNLDDDLIARLKRRVSRHGRSTEAEHREILRQALANEDEPSFNQLAAVLKRVLQQWAEIDFGVERGQANIRAHFLIDRTAAKLNAAYERLLGGA